MMLWVTLETCTFVHLGSFVYFSSDEILLFLCQHLLCFQVLWARFVGQGGISLPLIKDWAWTCPDSDSRRKPDSLMWSDRVLVHNEWSEGGKIHLEHLLLSGLCRDCGIPWSYRIKGWAGFAEKVADRPLEDPLKEAVGKKCTQCVKLPVFGGF